MSSLSPNDLLLLTDPLGAELVERHLHDDPERLAFTLKCERERARAVCGQVKTLQRARTKLPSYYAARCVIPPLSYEQCSSEAAAALKTYAGGLCIDLTCGLGVDSLHFSRSFDRVITVERDPILAEVARYNFARLDARNITVVTASAEAFLAEFDGEADLIYLDPARRDGDGGRIFLPQACSPNVVELLPLLLQKARVTLVKLSPLFDVQEALRLFAGHLSRVEIVSIGGEVKELLVELRREPPAQTEVVVSLDGGRKYLFAPQQIGATGDEAEDEPPPEGGFLVVPDAAFYKGRVVRPLLDNYFAGQKFRLSAQNGFAFVEEMPEGFPGRIYRLIGTVDYRPAKLRKELARQGIDRINLLRRDFPASSREIKQALNVREGGTRWYAFTRIAGEPKCLQIEPMNHSL